MNNKEEGIPNLGQRGRKEKDRKKFLTRLREYLTRVSKVANQTPSLSPSIIPRTTSLSLSTRCLPLSSKRERETLLSLRNGVKVKRSRVQRHLTGTSGGKTGTRSLPSPPPYPSYPSRKIRSFHRYILYTRMRRKRRFKGGGWRWWWKEEGGGRV